MAKMIPSDISIEIKSNAERKIFDWFKNAPNTEDWIVLHSLGISNHKTVIYGEIDFVVLAPKYGIFALEVKGGRIRRENGNWVYINKYNEENTKKRGPFEQAKEGLFSLIEVVNNRIGKNNKFTNFVHGFGVVFPDIDFITTDPEMESWQIFDKRNNKDIITFIKALGNNSRNRWLQTYGEFSTDKIPNAKDIREYANILRSDFDKYVQLSTMIELSEDKLISLTNEQYDLIDSWSDNPRMLVQGGAGTGKTLLAIEEAKNESRSGKKVALFCYNNLLGEWLKTYFAKCEENEKPKFVGTFHSYLFKIIKDNNILIPPILDEEFFENEIHLLGIEAILNSDFQFDKIIIDEAQDLISSNYIELIDLLLKSGLKRGKWTLYGDLSMQSIFNKNTNTEMVKLLDEYSIYSKYRLTKNCRNTKQISDEIKYLTGFEYSNTLKNNIDGLPVSYYSYDNIINLKEKLESVLNKLFTDGIKEHQITILSPRKKEESVLSHIENFTINLYDPNKHNNLTYSTIHSFKGLENSVIILVDIENYNDDQLLYVGISRARSMLIVFESNKSSKQRTEKIMRKYVK